jgi:flagellar biosynthesis/type III secretory pathway protein FliH
MSADTVACCECEYQRGHAEGYERASEDYLREIHRTNERIDDLLEAFHRTAHTAPDDSFTAENCRRCDDVLRKAS